MDHHALESRGKSNFNCSREDEARVKILKAIQFTIHTSQI